MQRRRTDTPNYRILRLGTFADFEDCAVFSEISDRVVVPDVECSTKKHLREERPPGELQHPCERKTGISNDLHVAAYQFR